MRRPQFSALRERLLRAGVAPRAVRRTIAELEDHFDDVRRELEAGGLDPKDARSQAYARMGSEEAIVASTLARPELMSWARRWPAVAFALLPAPAFAASFVGSIAVIACLGHLAHSWLGVGLGRSPGLQLFSRCFALWILWALPTAAAAVCTYAAWRRRISLLWPAVGIVLVGVLGSLTNFGVQWGTATSRTAISAGIGISTGHLLPPLVRAASTVGLALLIYAGCWLASRRAEEAGSEG